MGDKLHKKEKRLKYSSSFSGGLNEKNSFKKINSRVSVAETTDDHFARAKARCDQLQQQLDNLVTKKSRRKSKKRSSTRVTDGIVLDETTPFISVRTQPKKILQSVPRQRRIDPAGSRAAEPMTNDQNTVRRYGNSKIRSKTLGSEVRPVRNVTLRRQARPDGDNVFDNRPKSKYKSTSYFEPQEDSENDYDHREYSSQDRMTNSSKKGSVRRNVTPQENTKGYTMKYAETVPKNVSKITAPPTSRKKILTSSHNVGVGDASFINNNPVVEQLYNRKSSSIMKSTIHEDEISIPEIKDHRDENENQNNRKKISNNKVQQPALRLSSFMNSSKSSRLSVKRRFKYSIRRYELPTVASQMKQAGMRYYSGASCHNNIPFVVSKSTAPSHNIGVNLQQVLNGFKSQLPVSGIPLTIAHHMGLRHMPSFKSNEMGHIGDLSLESKINVINFGDKILPVVCGKYVSFERLLTFYRNGSGVVPKFLKSISRPNYFYTSMYNLTSHRDDLESTSSKFYNSRSQEAKQALSEYASLYHEYTQLEQRQRNCNLDYESNRRLEELVKELMHREELIRRIVENHKPMSEPEHPVRNIQSSTLGNTKCSANIS